MAEEKQEGITSIEAPEQEQEQVAPETEHQGEPITSKIPTKFANKSLEDVISAYSSLESKLGSMASERAQEREALEAKIRELETRYSQPQQSAPQHGLPVEEQDPVSLLDSQEWEQAPKEVLKKSLKGVIETVNKRIQHEQIQKSLAETYEYVTRQRQDNPDFVRREPLMQQLANQFAPLIPRHMLNSVLAVKALDLLSKGASLDYYEKQAVERAKQSGSAKRAEKQNAQTEATSIPGETKDFKDLPLEEMRKLLGRAD